MTGFVHLRNHSEFSLVDGLIRIKSLVQYTSSHNMPAVAITDFNNLYSLVKFQKAAFANGVKPIFGADIQWLGDDDQVFTMTLIAQNNEGYKNLLTLISKAYTEGQTTKGVFLRREWLEHNNHGLIMLSGALEGDIGKALSSNSKDIAIERASFWKSLFGDRFYIDLQRLGRHEEEQYVVDAVELADSQSIPIVATNSCCFMRQEDFEAHEVRVCINEGRVLDDPRRPRKYTEQQYVKSVEEMQSLFSDIPDALENTIAIAERCSVEIELGKYYLPEYPIPEGQTLETFFRALSHEGLTQRLEQLFGKSSEKYKEKESEYRERLDYEVDTILQMGFPGYFLIVMDFIRWAKEHNIPVGPGRGSGAGSLVAYSLEITDLDPLAYDLLFERFLNPERVSMPDFDVDFCMEKRDQVINYVADNYGREAVGQIITFGTMAAKAVVRDVARVQGKSYGLADKLSKMIPFEVGMTLEKALDQEETLCNFLKEDADATEIWDMAVQLEGTTRNVGKHAGGVVIAPSRLTDFAPLYCDESGQGLVTQYDKNDVEDAGLVKFDFLGLRTLTIIDWAVEMVNERKQKDESSLLDISKIPIDDSAVYTMLKEGITTAVFQLESRGMKDLIKRLLPDSFEDIVALVALFRPGPLQSGMVDDFINRKLGRAELAYPHPQFQHESLEPILRPTYGIILYQEQVMQIAQTMAGYSLGEADLLRRAMGKKKPEEMAKQRIRFMEGAAERNHGEDLAANIFDLMEKFAGYGFNKSHSAAYALVSYQTAWLKHHYPSEFMASVLSSELQNTDKIVTLIDECRNINVEFTPPDINNGKYLFSVDSQSRIVYGLGAIKGLGEGPVEAILEARKEKPFTDLFDFCLRTDSRKVNKRALEALIRSGAFDSLGEPRHILMQALPEAVKAAEQNTANDAQGIGDLFGEVVDLGHSDVYTPYKKTSPWLLQQVLYGEKETLGLFLSGHPIDSYENELQYIVKKRLKNLFPKADKQRVVGMIIAMRLMKNKKGETMAFLTLDDKTARIEVSVFAKTFSEVRNLLVKDAIIVVEGVVRNDDYTGGLTIRADEVKSLAQVRQDRVSHIEMKIESQSMDKTFVADLKKLLIQQLNHSGPGNCRFVINYKNAIGETKLRLGDAWKVRIDEEMVSNLGKLCGEENINIRYRENNFNQLSNSGNARSNFV